MTIVILHIVENMYVYIFTITAELERLDPKSH